ncbi:hypothetical protein pah_c050o102 [Parachlamydia acanthamoebae str. Hall's coccus]|nr:hypothetical protein pah_c050o102 [Parachlamydia acanthamoebae str. Hall's coccus]
MNIILKFKYMVTFEYLFEYFLFKSVEKNYKQAKHKGGI